MPLTNDDTIPEDAILFRVLKHPDWITNKDGTTRPSSAAFLESRQEVSHFINVPGMLDELRRIFPGWPIASVPATVVRQRGLAIERSPHDSPDDFRCDPATHVVVGPAVETGRSAYEKMARPIAKHPDVHIVPEAQHEPEP
jgi:hypothetical protein